jgi:hypothetical protein
MVEWLTLLLCIGRFRVHISGPAIGCPDFFVVFLSPWRQMPG